MKRAIFAAVILVVALVVVSRGCSSGGGKTEGDTLTRLSGDWVLKQLNGQDVSSMLGQGGRAPTMTIGTDGRVSGFAGINRYTSSLDVDRLQKGDFKLDGIAATRMAGSQEMMDVESKFTQALHEVTGFKLDGGNLNLTRGLDDTLLKFSR